MSTGLAGLVLGGMFLAAGFNLWLPILAHGAVDTLALLLIYSNRDLALKHLFL